MAVVRRVLWQGVLAGFIAGAINHFFIYFTVSPYPSFYLLFPDNVVYFRPSINFFYNGSFSVNFDSLQFSKLPPVWREYIRLTEPQATCLAPSGNYPGNLVWTLPFIGVVHWLNLNLHQIDLLYRLLWFVLSVYFTSMVLYVIFVLLYVIVSNNRVNVYYVYGIGFLFCFSHFFFYYTINIHLNSSSLVHIFSFLFFLLYLLRPNFVYIGIAVLLSSVAYFMNWRFAPVFFPFFLIFVYLGAKSNNFFYLLAFTLLVFISQVLWSYHVHKYTCRWSLTYPINHLGYVDCQGNFPSSCAFPTSEVTHYTIPMIKFEIELFQTLAFPHIHDRPRLMKDCISKNENCLPRYIQSCGLSDSVWRAVVGLYKCSVDSSKSDSIRSYCAFMMQKWIDKLVSEIYSKCFWLPIYKVINVFLYNVFHPSPAIDKGQSGYTHSSFVRKGYYFLQQGYVAVAYLGGLLAIGLGCWGWYRGWLADWRERLLFLSLAVYGFGPIVVPCLVGASEWRYFFPGIPFLYLLMLLVGMVALRRWKGCRSLDES